MMWYIKQLLPFSYWTRYRDEQGQVHFGVWRMWLGRCFDITDVVVGG